MADLSSTGGIPEIGQLVVPTSSPPVIVIADIVDPSSRPVVKSPPARLNPISFLIAAALHVVCRPCLPSPCGIMSASRIAICTGRISEGRAAGRGQLIPLSKRHQRVPPDRPLTPPPRHPLPRLRENSKPHSIKPCFSRQQAIPTGRKKRPDPLPA